MIETKSGEQFVAQYKDIEIPMWIKAGTILPILDHRRELSLLRAIKNPLALEIFVDEKQTAAGQLTTDDGWSTKDQKDKYEFTLTEAGLLSYQTSTDSNYGGEVSIDKITLFGIRSKPSKISAHEDYDRVITDYVYVGETQTLTITSLGLIAKLTNGQSKNLLSIEYSGQASF